MPDSPASSWEYANEGGIVYARSTTQVGPLELRAEHIRRARTGPHASVTVRLGGHDLADDLFNLLRGEFRRKLAKSAFAHLGPVEQKALPLDLLEEALARFCKRVMPEFLKATGIIEGGADEEPPPPSYILKPYVLEGGGTILFAPPGAGKSTDGFLKAVSIDAGCDKVWPVQQRHVLFINLERSADSINRRIWRVNRALGLPAKRRLRVLQARGKSIPDVLEQAQAAIQADGYEVVFLDSISRSGMGDLNTNEVGNAIVDALSSLTPTWFAIGHPSRGDTSHVYGSQMFDAGQDIGVRLTAQPSADRRTIGVALEITQANDIAIPPMELLAFEFDDGGLTGVRTATAREFPQLVANKTVSMGDQVYTFLLDVGAMSATDIAAEMGFNRSNLAALLRDDVRFCVAGKEGRKVLYGVKAQEG